MFIELELDIGPIVLNTNHIVAIYIGDPEEIKPPHYKYNYSQKLYISTLDGSKHSMTFESVDDDITTCFDYYNDIKKILEPVEIWQG